MRSVSVQYFSSPNVSKRKMSLPAATSARVELDRRRLGRPIAAGDDCSCSDGRDSRAPRDDGAAHGYFVPSLLVEILRGEHVRLERRRDLHDEGLELGVLNRRHERRVHRVDDALMEGDLVLQKRVVEFRTVKRAQALHGRRVIDGALILRRRASA